MYINLQPAIYFREDSSRAREHTKAFLKDQLIKLHNKVLKNSS